MAEHKLKFPEKLSGKRMVLVYPGLKHAKVLMKSYNNPAIGPNIKPDWKNRTLKEQKEWIIRRGEKRKKGEQLLYLIFSKTGSLIGSCNLQKMDLKNRTAEAGIWILPEFQNNGYAYRAMNLLLDYGFKKLNLNKIYYLAYSYNKESQRFAEKFGFKKKGVEKERYLRKNKLINRVIYLMIRSRWKRK